MGAVDDATSTTQDQPITPFDVSINDTNNPVGTTYSLYSATSTQGSSDISIANGLISYKPPAGFLGTDYVTYNACLVVLEENVCQDAQLAITVTASADMKANAFTVPATTLGSAVTVAFTCTNAGPSPAAAPTCLLSGIPASAAAVSQSCTSPPASLAVGSMLNCSAIFTPTDSSPFTLIATAGSTTTDPNNANNTANAAANTPSSSADMQANVFTVPATTVGSAVTVAFTCTNAGPSPAAAPTCLLSDIPASAAAVSQSCTSPPASLAVGSMLNCSATFTPTDNALFTLTATAGSSTTDPNNANNTAQASVTLRPRATDDSATTAAGTYVDIPVLDNDGNTNLPSGITLTPAAVGVNPDHGTVTVNSDGSLRFTPANGFAGTTQFTYTVCTNDTIALCSDSATVTVSVGALPQATTSGASVNVLVQPSGGTQVPSVVTQPTGGTVTVENGQLVYTANTDFRGTDTITYQLCNTDLPAVCGPELTASVIVVGAVDDHYTTPFNTPTTQSIGNNDGANPDNITYAFAPFNAQQSAQLKAELNQNSTQGGTVTLDSDTGVLLYTPPQDFSGVDTVPYQVCAPAPNTDECAKATVYIAIVPPGTVVTPAPDVPDTPSTTPVENIVSIPSLTPAVIPAPMGMPSGSTHNFVGMPPAGITLSPSGEVQIPAQTILGDITLTTRHCLPAPNQAQCQDVNHTVTVTPNANNSERRSSVVLNSPLVLRPDPSLPSGGESGFVGTVPDGVSIAPDGTITVAPQSTPVQLTFISRHCHPAPRQGECVFVTHSVTVMHMKPIPAMDDWAKLMAMLGLLGMAWMRRSRPH